jgi:TRAP-type mannitol/chloroaromatic compound transport system substrate-binding protein
MIENRGADASVSRRRFIGSAIGAVAAGSLGAGCSLRGSSEKAEPDLTDRGESTSGDPDLDDALQASDLPTMEWTMATSWPASLDVIDGGAEFFASQVARLTGDRFRITSIPGGTMIPSREVLQNVQSKAVHLGFTVSAYYTGLDPITQFATTVPFGMTARQHWSWLHAGGGLAMLQGIYRERFGLVNIPAGNTGAQMGGWFTEEVDSIADLEGLRMRIRGVGAAVLAKLGVSVEIVPDDKIVGSLASGAIDAAAWIGPHDDVKQGLNTVAQVYHYPGWWSPGPSIDLLVGAERFDGLPEEYQAALELAAGNAYHEMLARYDLLNPLALATIRGSALRIVPFPDEVMDAAATEAQTLLEANASVDADYRAVLDSYNNFRAAVGPWHGFAESAVLDLLAG